MNSPHLSHRTLALLSAGCLECTELAAAREHLTHCPFCAAEWQPRQGCARSLQRAVEAAPQPAESPGLTARIARRLSLPKQSPARLEGWLQPALAALVLLLAAAGWSWHAPSGVFPQASHPALRRPAPTLPPPSLWACEQAAAHSEEALLELFDRQSRTILPAPPEATRAGAFTPAVDL